ncbi:MAG: adenylate/guanylate cyclase domain-containing protein [Acidimicrobiales bacterium]
MIEILTFFFTDIEGSTNLLRRLGEDIYARALADHHMIVRDGLRAHDGKEVGTHGDSFFATFTSPRACVASAVAIQQTLSRHRWPSEEDLRVRMGIHTGEASEASTGLVGYEVHRAARIAAVAHGGQVLLSSAAAGLVEDSLPPDVALRELGLHRLKDLGRPETLFQLLAPGLRLDFPSLRSLDNPELPNNLPASLNPFIGRESEIGEVRRLVFESRLVTLTGAGGSGKTRLALQVAAELLDGSGEGVWLVELAPIHDPGQISTAVLEALQLRPEANLSARDSLLQVLQDQNVLLVLDNCEHIIDEVAIFADLIGKHCPRVSLLATSREPLGIGGEVVYRVRSLSLPANDVESVAELDGSDAVQLFVARAQARDSTFKLDDADAPIVASVCRRLDGIPLAIELAAARLSSMSLIDLHRRLDQRFRLLTGGSRNALPRQQTLGATVAWSYDLLNEPEREVLRRLTVFVDGFDLDAAEAVCATGAIESFDVTDILGSLVNKSLVTGERASGTLRYAMLETIRQYAVEQLLQVDGDTTAYETRLLHAEHYLRLAEAAAPAIDSHGQVVWVKRLTAEWGNLKASFEFFSANSDRSVDVLRLGVALTHLCVIRQYREPIEYLRNALATAPHDASSLSIRALHSLALLENFARDDLPGREAVRDGFQQSVEGARKVGDERLESEALAWLSRATKWLGDGDEAIRLATESLTLARSIGDANLVGSSLNALANALPTREEGQPLHEEALDLFRSVGNLSWACAELIALSLMNLETVDDVARNRKFAEEAVAVAEEVGANWALPIVWGNLAVWCGVLGDVNPARTYARRSIVVNRRIGKADWHQIFNILTLSWCAAVDGEYELAAALDGAHQALQLRVPGHAGFIYSPPETQWETDNQASILAALGSDGAQRLTSIGRALPVEQVIDLALGRTRHIR